MHLVNLAIKQFVDSKVTDQPRDIVTSDDQVVSVIIPFKDQASANIVKRHLNDLSLKTKNTIQPVFISRKLHQNLRIREKKPPIVNHQCVVYSFQYNLCDVGHVNEKTRYIRAGKSRYAEISWLSGTTRII